VRPFRATYRPEVYDEGGGFIGYDEDKVEQVVIVHIEAHDWERNPNIVFVHSDGRLDSAPMTCFSECKVDW